MKYSVPDGVLRAQLEGDEVMLNPTTGVYHMLNRTGRLLIESLQHGRSLDEAVDEIAAASHAPRDSVMADARSFLSAMLERGLVREAPK